MYIAIDIYLVKSSGWSSLAILSLISSLSPL
jgi:hypothetical protein